MFSIYFSNLEVLEKEVEDILRDCINPNFVELPRAFEIGTHDSATSTPRSDGDVVSDSKSDSDSTASDTASPQLPTSQGLYSLIPKPDEGGVYIWVSFDNNMVRFNNLHHY